MSEIKELQDGIYEKVMSVRFAKALEEALAAQVIWAQREEVDSQEAIAYLSKYLEKLVRISLKKIADENGDDGIQREVALTNSLVKKLVQHIRDLGEDQEVEGHAFLLKSLEHQRNKIKEKKWQRPSTSLDRSFLFTNSQNDVSMVHELQKEIASSDRMDMLVSFIRFSGLSMILPYLQSFTAQGGQLRVVTTTYMGATDPKAVFVLSQLPNTEVRISYNVKETRLHAKSYMFHRNSGYSTAYVGSSNLSHAAIAEGMEWNVKVTEQDLPNIIEKMRATFLTYWHSDDFKPFHPEDREKLSQAIDRERGRKSEGTAAASYSFDIHPYPYQQAILDALDMERRGKDRWHNLVVAATGTGKTAISAFDYRRFAKTRKEGAKLLFIAHREEILKQSRDCFRQVMKAPHFGELAVGTYRATRPEHLFLSIQTFNSQKFWEKVDPDYYDMIVVDEFHHAAAKSYQQLLSYFHPKILLGLTATPERMDGGNILKYFGGHMAAEIRLPDAIERRLLCPFHYFGVDDPISLKDISWNRGHYDEKALEQVYTAEGALAKQRARAIGAALERYTADMRDVKALGFCVSKKHAHFMADYFNKEGIPALALDADSPKDVRQAARQQLEEGQVRILFVVDLFNEGVDIPAVNTVLFLRPTQSMTVFLQQLGRGLRLCQGKDCLTVLDFVAQANRKYDFASRYAALLGKKQVVIQKEIKEDFPHVPKGCSIQMEEKAQKWVLENIQSRLRRNEFYIELIRELAESTRAIPSLADFFKAAAIDPHDFYNGKHTYVRLLADAEVIPDFPVTEEEVALRKAFPRILSIDSPAWISWLLAFYTEGQEAKTKIETAYLRMWTLTLYPNLSEKDREVWQHMVSMEGHKELKQEIEELLAWQMDALDQVPGKADLPYDCALEVYCNYSRDQLLAALGLENPSSVREGVKFLHAGNSEVVTTDTDVFLVTLNKSEKEFSDTTLYEDYSIDKTLFHWQSQSTTAPDSKNGQRYIHQREKGNIVLLFVRAAKKDSYKNAMAYTFLGPAQLVKWEGSQPMSIIYRLDHPIPAKYITKTDTSGVL